MRLVYTPDGDEDQAQSWEINLGRFRSAETEMIEKRTGMDWGTDFTERLMKGNMLARRALLWALQRRTHPMIRFEDVDFAHDEVLLEFDRDELLRQRAEVEKAPLNDLEKAAALAYLDDEIAKAPRPEPGEEGVGKADEPSSESGTGSGSPKSRGSRRGSTTG